MNSSVFLLTYDFGKADPGGNAIYEYSIVPPGRRPTTGVNDGPQNAVAPVMVPTSPGVKSTRRCSPKGPVFVGRVESPIEEMTWSGVSGGTGGAGVFGICSASPLCSAQNAVRRISSNVIG